MANFCSFLAADPKGAVFVLVEHVPNPGNRRLTLRHFDGEIAAHTERRGLLTRNHREAARLRFIVEVLNELLELSGRQTVDGIEGNGRAAGLYN
jgi:hypothetical protein